MFHINFFFGLDAYESDLAGVQCFQDYRSARASKRLNADDLVLCLEVELLDLGRLLLIDLDDSVTFFRLINHIFVDPQIYKHVSKA